MLIYEINIEQQSYLGPINYTDASHIFLSQNL